VKYKQYTWLRLLLLVLAVSLTGAACNGINIPRLNANLDNAAPTAETETPPTAQRFRVSVSSASQHLEQLESYRAAYRIEFTGSRAGQEVAGQVELLADVNRPQQAYHYAQSIDIAGEAPRRIEMFQLNTAVYLADESEPAWFKPAPGQVIDPADFGILAGLENLVILPPTTLTAPEFDTWQGRSVQKYVFTGEDLHAPQLSFEQASGELLVDTAQNYVVRYALTATVQSQNLLPASRLPESGQVRLEYALNHPNGVNIRLPAPPALISNTLTSLPRPPYAQLTAIYPALLEYTSAITPISATHYFGSHLPPLGWTQTITSVFIEKARLGFAQNDENMTVLIAPAEEPGQNRVVLSLSAPTVE